MYRCGSQRDADFYGSVAFQNVLRHSYPSKRNRISPQDVAFAGLVVEATLQKVTLLGMDDIEGTYDALVKDALQHLGRHEARNDAGKILSSFEVTM